MGRDDTDWDSKTFELSGTHALVEPAADPDAPRYAPVGELGRGGLGEVMAVRDGVLEREVALKASLAQREIDILRFWHEARVTALLDHPNIVPVYDAGLLDDDRPFFVMKKIVGENLFEAITAGKLPTLRERLEVFRTVCDAVAYAHDKGWMHRDLKPENVMLGPFGEVLVVDWGLAWQTDGSHPPPAGTPRYMAPEQAGIAGHDARADVYALGGVLWFLLVREEPWQGDLHPLEIVEKLREGIGFTPRGRGRAPRELVAIVQRALTVSPDGRYASVTDLAADVVRFLDGRRVEAARYSPLQRLGKWSQRHRRAVTGALVALLLGGAVLGAVGLVSGAAVLRSASRANAAADRASSEASRAAQAEADTRVQLVEALVAGASAHILGGRFSQAEQTLLRADAAVGDGPAPAALDLAWADLTSRGTWPIWTSVLDGPAADLVLNDDAVLLLLESGRWERRTLIDQRMAGKGQLPGRGLAIVGPDRFVVVDDDALVLTDGEGTRLARTLRPDPGVPIWDTWVTSDALWVQSYAVQRDVATLSAFDLETLAPREVPPALAERFLQAISVDGQRLATSDARRPDRTRPTRITDPRGRTLHDLPSGRAVLAPGRIAHLADREITLVDERGTPLWSAPSPRGFEGLWTPTHLLAATEEGTMQLHDAETGALYTRLLGFAHRPDERGASPDGRWVVQTSTAGELAVWAVPETTGVTGQAIFVSTHPGGRLAAITRVDPDQPTGAHQLTIEDLPTGTVVADLGPTKRRAGTRTHWSPDGRKLVHNDPLGVLVTDLTTGEREVLRGGSFHVAWSDSQLVAAGFEGVHTFDPETLEPRESWPEPVAAWRAVALSDGSVMISANLNEDGFIGYHLPAGEAPVPIRGGDPQVAGFGVRELSPGVVGFARQDGTVAIRRLDGAAGDVWKWQAAPVFDLLPRGDTTLVVTYDGRLHQLDSEGQPTYATSFSDTSLIHMEPGGPGVVLVGYGGTRYLDLGGRLPPEGYDRLGRARAWSRIRHGNPADTLSHALVTGEDLEAALSGTDAVTAAIVRRGLADRR